MKRTLLAIAAFAVVLSSCQKETTADDSKIKGEDKTMSFTATILSTRTTLTNNQIFWSEGDQISINGETFTADISKTPTIFTREESKIQPPFNAVFPSSLEVTTGNYELPSTQTYSGSKVDNLPMYATSSNNKLEFQNLCAVLGVTVKSSDMASVKSIKVSCSNIDMYGAFTVENGKAKLKENNGEKKSIVLECSEAVSTADDGTVFYIALPEADYENLTVELSSDGTNYTKTMNARKNNISMVANTIYPWNFLPVGYYPLSENPTVSTAL